MRSFILLLGILLTNLCALAADKIINCNFVPGRCECQVMEQVTIQSDGFSYQETYFQIKQCPAHIREKLSSEYAGPKMLDKIVETAENVRPMAGNKFVQELPAEFKYSGAFEGAIHKGTYGPKAYIIKERISGYAGRVADGAGYQFYIPEGMPLNEILEEVK